MRHMTTAIASVTIFLLLGVGAAYPNTVKTGTGRSVDHIHPTTCYPTDPRGPVYCPTSDSSFESSYSFRSSNRAYPASIRWNCHGRTFNNRASWIPFADPYLTYDGPSCPVKPVAGDTIIWIKNGKTSHSVTIVGTYNSLSTPVMSKYGSQGQYKHTLADTVRVYGSNWTVTRFSGGTPIYSSVTAKDQVSQESRINDLLAQRASMPWFKDVLLSEALYQEAQTKLLNRTGRLSLDARKRLATATDDSQIIEALVSDLWDASHYETLAAFNSPEFAEDFISAIVSGDLLRQMARNKPEVRPIVIAALRDLGLDESAPDYARGSALNVLRTILTEDERALTRDEFQPLLREKASKSENSMPTYFEYYARKL